MTATTINVGTLSTLTTPAVNYFDLAKRMAAGESFDAADVKASCDAEHKTIGNLQTLVATIKQREVQRAEHGQLDGLKQRSAELRAAVDQQNRLLDDAVERHQEACRPLQDELLTIDDDVRRLQQIPTELRNTCPDPRIAQRIRELGLRRAQLQQDAKHAGERLRDAQRGLQEAAGRLATPVKLDDRWLRPIGVEDEPIDIKDPLKNVKRDVLAASRDLQTITAVAADCHTEAARLSERLINY